MKDRAEKFALALVFGVMMQGSIISAIPGNVPGLSRILSCSSCKVVTKGGLPTQFVPYMSEAQKRAYKQAMKRKAK